MPSDEKITQDECDKFIEAIDFFKNYLSNECVPLFIFSVSEETGLGMYESISDVLMAQDKDVVKKHLRLGLQIGNDGVKYRCCWWASDIDAWDLEQDISPLINHANADISDAAKTFIQLKNEIA